MSHAEDAIILIPSLHPDHQLIDYVNDLVKHGFGRIVVVDDGSGPDYAHFFEECRSLPQVEVLGYAKNQGKGYALKHGIRYILEAYPQAPGVITADSDGQHTAEDCLKVAQAMLAEPQKLVLGSRDFSLHNIPPKSRAGNRLTSFFFTILYGHWLPDTQTGLRGISRELMPRMLQIPGARFEYEMNMLIHIAGWRMEFSKVPISTIYHNANVGSHFRPFHDSARIYKLLFANFFKFASASALSTLLDIVLFTLLDRLVIPWLSPHFTFNFKNPDYSFVLMATVIARVYSALFNYHINRQFVFQIEKNKGSLLKYALLVVVVMLASATLVHGLHSLIGMNKTLAKILVDTTLFFINYRVMKAWVFRASEERNT